MAASKRTLAVWKFASCDGCQLTLLDCEDELLEIAEQVEIAYFLEATRATVEGDYELACAELCGFGHYKMRGVLHVVTDEEYEQFLQEELPFLN